MIVYEIRDVVYANVAALMKLYYMQQNSIRIVEIQ